MPVVDDISADYVDQVTFVAVAGRSGFEETAERADQWFSDRILWGLDKSIWQLYGVFGQPYTFLITGDDRIVAEWAGLVGESQIRQQLD